MADDRDIKETARDMLGRVGDRLKILSSEFQKMFDGTTPYELSREVSHLAKLCAFWAEELYPQIQSATEEMEKAAEDEDEEEDKRGIDLTGLSQEDLTDNEYDERMDDSDYHPGDEKTMYADYDEEDVCYESEDSEVEKFVLKKKK